jgi:hypothetical protein
MAGTSPAMTRMGVFPAKFTLAECQEPRYTTLIALLAALP